jgi:2-keto-4-pentenoate hydratase/2-oxohepta-3-ene-1,7-dioic acid hydratase in catechol pathway
MRLVTLNDGGKLECAAILPDGSALRLGSAFASMQALIEAGPAGLERVRGLIAKAPSTPKAIVAAKDVKLAAPLPRPAKNVFCVGRNYAEHIAEGERAHKAKIGIAESPTFFTKPPTSVIGPDAVVPLFPHVTSQMDYEVELAVIIGKSGRDIPAARAFEHVFGYTIVNDVSARDLQRRHGGQFFKGKALDGSCPMGPWIVTADEILSPGQLGIRLRINGELRQNGNTSQMIFDIATQIASLSAGMTLEAGDIIATGTPSGVGFAMEPPRYLQDGDVAECEIDGIGKLTNAFSAT